jgi:uncharacterized protein YpiB (UPF0302 family)
MRRSRSVEELLKNIIFGRSIKSCQKTRHPATQLWTEIKFIIYKIFKYVWLNDKFVTDFLNNWNDEFYATENNVNFNYNLQSTIA